LNVVWGTAEIKGVIDWEFCGVKPEIYDAALLISCIGIEGPKAFKSPLIRQFLKGIREQGLYQRQSWDNLLEYMVALRLAWLVEWIRKNNEEMLMFEMEYVKALVEYREIIRKTLLS
jgi:Phosphotransferase enzyme family.